MTGTEPWQIRSNDRLFMVGKTGSGKTAAATKLVWDRLDDVVFFDMTGEEASDLNAPVLRSLEDVETALYAEEPDHLTKFVYAPEVPTLDGFERLCRMVYEHGNIHLVADELLSFCR